MSVKSILMAMARLTKMVADTPARASSPNNLEAHLVSYQPVCTDANETADGEPGLWSSLLISASRSRSAQATFAALRHAYASARYEFALLAASDLTAELRQFLATKRFCTLDMVVFLDGESMPLVSRQRLIDEVRRNGPGIRIGVDNDCSSWSSTDGLVGCVKGQTITSTDMVVATMSYLVALNAPDTLVCMDREDLPAVLGTPRNPSILVQAIWLRAEQRLVDINPQGSDILQQTKVMTVHLIGADLQVKETAIVVQTLRECLPATCNFTFQAPLNLSVPAHFQRDLIFVSMICRVSD